MQGIKLIDEVFLAKARAKSKVVQRVDGAWGRYMRTLEERVLALPFGGRYTAEVWGEHLRIEGYKGPLLINKLHCYRKTYRLTPPISHADYSIFAVYSTGGHLAGFGTEPLLGFHYLGASDYGRLICIGDLRYEPPNSLQELQVICQNILRMFRVININSLGSTLPSTSSTHRYLFEVLQMKDMDIEEKVRRLREEKVIEEISLEGGA